jgi:SAM-dependent MidA family methyltransferase
MNRMPNLPTPPLELQLCSQQLTAVIGQAIQAKQGAISFADYMSLALYAPGLGYYSGGLAKFGEAGDFITAPELSALFGRCVAQQCAEILSETGGQILEFGAGSGKLALDVLSHLAELNCLPERYLIIEPSAELQQRQCQLLRAKMPTFIDKITWLNRLPENFVGVVLANEVLDAMPVHLFEIDGQAIYERWVGLQAEQFIWQKQPLAPELALTKRVNALKMNYGKDWPHYISEVSLMIPAWLASVARMLQQGVVLLVDYGFPAHEFYHPERCEGTLMCHYRHHAHSDPFYYPGLQDITAHVDFTLVAEAASEAGFDIVGYTNQAAFLLNTGLLEGLNKLAITEEDYFSLSQQVKKLTLPHEMGELFKVMALSKNVTGQLCGFSLQDMRHRL